MAKKPGKDRLDELAEFIDLEALPELVEDDTSSTVVDISGTLDIEDESVTEDDEGSVDDAVTIDHDYSDDGWTDDAISSESGSVDISVLDDVVVDLDADEASEDTEDSKAFLDNLVDDTELAGDDADNGAEGPMTSEVYEIDVTAFEPLDDGDDSDSEDIFETMSRLELTLDPEKDDDVSSESAPLISEGNAEVSFIGPNVGEVYAATFHRGAPIGVGDGMYVLGADQMLHEVPLSGLQDMVATSVVGHREALFVGTTCQGAFVSVDRGRSVHAINSWYTQGLDKGDSMRSGAYSTAFTLAGQSGANGFRLLGWTGEGQLYSSTDDGESWEGPLLKGWRCETLRTEKNGDVAVVLAVSRSSSGTLLSTRDFESFHPLTLPASLSSVMTTANAVFDVAPGVVAAGMSVPGSPLFLSFDEGNTWHQAKGVTGITALVIDQEASDWIAVAVTGRGGAPTICISENRGKNWREVCALPAPATVRKHSPITSLVLKDDGFRALVALTENGVYMVHPDQKKMTH